MARRTQSVIVENIITFIDIIDSYTNDMTYPEFSTRQIVIDACMHNIHVIGESIDRISDEARQKSDSIPWNLISGMQNRLMNDDLEADPEVVWHVINTALPELKSKLERLHKRLVARNM